VEETLRGWRGNLVRIIEAGQQSGELRAGVDAAHYATVFMALIEGGMLLANATGDAQSLFTTLDHLEHLIETELVA
jgi:TetR/AcrR family transcriptional repressor of nem operon